MSDVSTELVSTSRLEAFSDGVMAIAITLLVLDLKVPARDGGTALLHSLGHEWPQYVAFVVSFLLIGVIWLNHHDMFVRIRRVDRVMLLVNLLLLLVISALPFTTSLLAEYLTAGSEGRVAGTIYSASMLVMALLMTALWVLAARHEDLLADGMTPAEVRASVRSFGFGGAALTVVTVAALVLPAWATLALNLLVSVGYVIGRLGR